MIIESKKYLEELRNVLEKTNCVEHCKDCMWYLKHTDENAVMCMQVYLITRVYDKLDVLADALNVEYTEEETR